MNNNSCTNNDKFTKELKNCVRRILLNIDNIFVYYTDLLDQTV